MGHPSWRGRAHRRIRRSDRFAQVNSAGGFAVVARGLVRNSQRPAPSFTAPSAGSSSNNPTCQLHRFLSVYVALAAGSVCCVALIVECANGDMRRPAKAEFVRSPFVRASRYSERGSGGRALGVPLPPARIGG